MELLLTLEEFCSEEGTFEGLQEGGRHFTAIFPKARAVPRMPSRPSLRRPAPASAALRNV